MRHDTCPVRSGFSLTELIAVVAIIGIAAAIILPRVTSHADNGNRQSCFLNKGEIELQVQLWKHHQGSYPAANLADIGADVGYFPSGLPTCPVDGTTYTIDTTTGIVTGHTH